MTVASSSHKICVPGLHRVNYGHLNKDSLIIAKQSSRHSSSKVVTTILISKTRVHMSVRLRGKGGEGRAASPSTKGFYAYRRCDQTMLPVFGDKRGHQVQELLQVQVGSFNSVLRHMRRLLAVRNFQNK